MFVISVGAVGFNTEANAQAQPKSIEGTVTILGINVVEIMDRERGKEYQISINEIQERELTTGYMIRGKIEN